MGFQTTTYRFAAERVRREVKTHCLQCGKKLKRVLSNTFYNNGLHVAAETRKKYEAIQSKEAKRMEREGVLCGKCK